MRLALLLLLAAPLLGAAPAADPRPTRQPSIRVEEALARARAYVQEKKLDVSRHYVDSVVYELNPRGDRGPFWRVTWQLKEYAKGGQLFVMLYRDGSIEQTYGE